MLNADYYYLKMKTHYLSLPYSGKKRRVRVLLPKNYQQESVSYPVVYMHDGQNVFYSKESFLGYSWKVIPTLKRNPDLPKMIVVGIDNDPQTRADDYNAWSFENPSDPKERPLGGLGNDFSDFIMKVVKPFIDTTYRTKTDKKHTAMIGSSFGANITAYMGVKYADQIGRLGIFSLAQWIVQEPFDRYLKSQDLDPEQKIYLQVGTKEGDDTDRLFIPGNMAQAYIDASLHYQALLIAGGIPVENIDFNIYVDEEHNEFYWAKHLPDCLRFLSSGWWRYENVLKIIFRLFRLNCSQILI